MTLPLGIAQSIDGEHLRVNVAALGAVPYFSGPVARLNERAPHVFIELPALEARFEQARILAQSLFAAVAGDAGEGVIHLENCPVGIGDRDAFTGMGEDGGRQAEPFFGFFALGDVFA